MSFLERLKSFGVESGKLVLKGKVTRIEIQSTTSLY